MADKLNKDYKIHEALNLLKGLHILSTNKNKEKLKLIETAKK